MRKITQDAIKALYENKNFKRSNTEVKVFDKSVELLLHGNPIAVIEYGKLFIRHAGYPTNTTKERLNGLPNVHIQQKNWRWFLNGEEWTTGGSWTKVEDWPYCKHAVKTLDKLGFN